VYRHIDHIGMLLRHNDSRLFLLEATKNYGVELFRWNNDSLRQYMKGYSLIVYRPIEYKRTYKLIQQLENFLNVRWQYKVEYKREELFIQSFEADMERFKDRRLLLFRTNSRII